MKKNLQGVRDLIIYGGGGFGRETALMVEQINAHRRTWNVVGFCDDQLKKGTIVQGLNVIGGLIELNNYNKGVGVAIAVADPKRRMELRNKIQNRKIDFPVLIHPSVMLGHQKRNQIGEGSILAAGTILTTDIHIESFVIINLACTIGHDVVINDFSSIMPGCSLSGAVTIKRGVLIGSGAVILQCITVGENSRVGAGAVVTRDVPSKITVAGVPAKAISSKST